MENTFEIPELTALLHQETKDTIWQLWLEPLIHFANDSPNATWGTLKAHDILSFISQKKNPNKADFVNLCAKVYSNAPFLMSYYNSLPPISKDIIFRATWTSSISQEQLNELLKGPAWSVALNNTKYDLSLYYGQVQITLHESLKPWFRFLSYGPSYLPFHRVGDQEYEKIIKLTLKFSLLMRKVFAAAIPKPSGYYLEESSQQLPEGSISFSFEKQIFRELPLFLAYYKQGNLSFTQKGAPNLASVKKMDKVVKLEPFPLEENFYLRSNLIAGLFSDSFGKPSANDDSLSILKRLFEPGRSEKEWRPYPPFLLSYLKGIRNLDTYYFDTGVTKDIFGMATKLPVNKWISRENLAVYLRAHFIHLKFIETSHLDRMSSDFSQKHYFGYSSTEKEIWDNIHFPNFLGHLYLLAAFGLLEIAEDPDWFMEYSFYDHFTACKLTNLGAFIFGQINAYEVPENAGGVKIIPAQDSLTATVEGNTAVGEVLLKDFLQKVSENKFKLSPEGFLKDCTNEKSLKNKINLFKQVINKDLPPYWESYFEELIKNSRSIKSSSEFFVFKLPVDNKQLLNIIVKDPDLKKIVIKAEQYHVLLKKSDKGPFISKLKSYGYLPNIS